MELGWMALFAGLAAVAGALVWGCAQLVAQAPAAAVEGHDMGAMYWLGGRDRTGWCVQHAGARAAAPRHGMCCTCRHRRSRAATTACAPASCAHSNWRRRWAP